MITYQRETLASEAEAAEGFNRFAYILPGMAAMFNSVLILLMSFLAVNIMPINQLPVVLRETVSRWMPNYWFHQSIVRLEVRFAGRRPVPTGFEQSVPGYMVMFIMMNLLMYGGISIAGERTSGVLRRIAVHPIAKWQLIAGKILGRFLLGLVQIGFFLVAGRVLFGVTYGGNLLLVTLTLAVFAWLCAALGVLVGAVIESLDRVQGLCLLLSLLMAAMGGCW